jgi:UPF0716 protein FxsA
MLLLVALLLAAPFVEIAVMVQVADWIGFLDMVGLLLVISVAGVFVVKHQGTSAWQRIRTDLQMGRVPAASLVDGALILTAGVLLVVPGFVTDAIGLLLLLPPVRHLVRAGLGRRFRTRVAVVSTSGGAPGPGATRGYPGDVIDVEGAEQRGPTRANPELEPPSPN